MGSIPGGRGARFACTATVSATSSEGEQAPMIPFMSSGPPCGAYTGRQVAVGGALERKHSRGNKRSRLDRNQYAPLDRNDTRADFETSPMQTSPPTGPALNRAILIRRERGSVIRRSEPAAVAPIPYKGGSQVGSRRRLASRTPAPWTQAHLQWTAELTIWSYEDAFEWKPSRGSAVNGYEARTNASYRCSTNWAPGRHSALRGTTSCRP